MKIICKKCHKRFDGDLYSYVCPKCGTYSGSRSNDYVEFGHVESDYTEPDYVEPDHAEPDYAEPSHAEPSYVEPDHAESDHAESDYAENVRTETSHAGVKLGGFGSRQKVVKTKSKHNGLFYIVVILLLVIIIGMPLQIQPLTRRSVEKKREERSLTEELSINIIQQGKWFAVEGKDESFTVTIDTANVVDVPEGINKDLYEMIEVNYHIGDDLCEDEQYYYSDELRTDVVLITKSGEILESVSPYALSNMNFFTEEEEYEKGVSASLQYRWGSIYYLVKKGDCQGLIITTYEQGEDSYTIEDVRERYMIDELEVTR